MASTSHNEDVDPTPVRPRRWLPWLGAGLILLGVTEFVVGQLLLADARAERTAELRRNAVGTVAEIASVIHPTRGESFLRIAYTIDGQSQSTLLTCPTFDCSDEQVGDTIVVTADRSHPWRVITAHGEQYISNGPNYDYLVIIGGLLPLGGGVAILQYWRAVRRPARPRREIDFGAFPALPPR
jgi:hypothetical protein